MDKLESDINSLMNQINQNWVNAVRSAERNNTPLDISEMFGKYSEIIEKKDKAFQDAKIRTSGNKKSRWGWSS